MQYLSSEWKKKIIQENAGSEKNTGSAEAQVALFTERINYISGHLKTHEKDHSTRRSLLKLVGKRKRLLGYLSKRDIQRYRVLVEKLQIRK